MSFRRATSARNSAAVRARSVGFASELSFERSAFLVDFRDPLADDWGIGAALENLAVAGELGRAVLEQMPEIELEGLVVFVRGEAIALIVHSDGQLQPSAGWPGVRRRCFGPLPWGALDNRSTYCHCKYVSSVKDERLQIRVGPAEKRLLERAAEASHLSVSAFVVQSAAGRAEEVLAERQVITLGHSAAAALSNALERPGQVNGRLAEALGRRHKFRWID